MDALNCDIVWRISDTEFGNSHLTLRDAGTTIEAWRVDYNEVRPHSSLDRLTPAEYAGLHQQSEENLAITSSHLP